jgi:hypothetical protein
MCLLSVWVIAVWPVFMPVTIPFSTEATVVLTLCQSPAVNEVSIIVRSFTFTVFGASLGGVGRLIASKLSPTIIISINTAISDESILADKRMIFIFVVSIICSCF